MSDSVNQIFMKVIAINLIVIGVFAVVSPLLAIYLKKYDNKSQPNKLYLYLVGGIILIIIGTTLY
jgi:putative Mn2+ efflux pump MntP